MSSFKRFITLTAGCVAACAMPAASSLAQNVGKPRADSLEEVVVTARRREESLQAVPISITAVSGEELIKKGVQNAYDLQHSVPSLTMSTSGTMTKAMNPGIRSVSTRSFLLLDDPAVGTYFAEAVVGHPWGFGNTFYDIQSVQTLKGPQGTLFGRNTTGGAIIIEPNKPSFDGFDGNLKTSVGDYDFRQVSGMINIPFSDIVAVRIAGEYKRRDGYTTNILNGQERDGVASDAGRFQLLLRPTENISSNTLVDYLEEDTSPSGAKLVALYGPNGGFGLFGPTTPANNAFVGLSRILGEQRARDEWDVAQMGGTNVALPITDPLYASTAQDQHSPLKCDPSSPYFVPNHYCRSNMMPKETLKTLGIVNNTSIDIGGLTVKNIYSYRDMEHQNQDSATFPLGSELFFTGLAAAGQPQVSIAGGGQADQTNELSQVSDELQLQGKAFGERLDWVTGLFYMREWGQDFSPSYTNSPNWSSTAGQGRNISKAVYAQGTYAWTEKFKVTLGARQTWDERTAKDVSTAQNGTVCQTFNLNAAGVEVRDVFPACLLEGTKKWKATSYTASVDYQLTDGTMVYALRSRGYKSGGFSLRSHRPSIFSYDPEFMNNTEVGVKSDWSLFDRPIRTNLSVFRMDYSDQQLTTTVPGSNPVQTFVDNIGKSRIVGAEFELVFRPVQSVDLSGFFSYTDADYLEWDNNIGVVGGVNYGVVDLSDRPVGFYSKYNAGLSAAWTLPLASTRGELSVRADAAYHSEWLTDNSVAGLLGAPASATAIPGIAGFTMVPQDAYTLVNLRADWVNALGGPIDLGVFVSNVTDQEVLLGGAGVNGMVSGAVGPPRLYGVELAYRFGAGFKPKQ